jgi:hypothetical protein
MEVIMKIKGLILILLMSFGLIKASEPELGLDAAISWWNPANMLAQVGSDALQYCGGNYLSVAIAGGALVSAGVFYARLSAKTSVNYLLKYAAYAVCGALFLAAHESPRFKLDMVLSSGRTVPFGSIAAFFLASGACKYWRDYIDHYSTDDRSIPKKQIVVNV